LELAALITLEITRSFEEESLGALYLAKRVRFQLVGRDDPQILMDPPEFMLASHCTTNVKFHL